jgi:hypothetical protein
MPAFMYSCIPIFKKFVNKKFPFRNKVLYEITPAIIVQIQTYTNEKENVGVGRVSQTGSD